MIMFDNCLTEEYTVHMTCQITTRQLLREFKKYREMMQRGELQSLSVDVGNNQELNITIRNKGKTGSALIEALSDIGPIHITRPEGLFDDLLEPRSAWKEDDVQ